MFIYSLDQDILINAVNNNHYFNILLLSKYEIKYQKNRFRADKIEKIRIPKESKNCKIENIAGSV
jgi:hypothetical protein